MSADEPQNTEESADLYQQLAAEADAGAVERIAKRRKQHQARERVASRLRRAALAMFAVVVITCGLMIYTESIVWGLVFAVSLVVDAVIFVTLLIRGDLAPAEAFDPEEAVTNAIGSELLKGR